MVTNVTNTTVPSNFVIRFKGTRSGVVAPATYECFGNEDDYSQDVDMNLIATISTETENLDGFISIKCFLTLNMLIFSSFKAPLKYIRKRMCLRALL